MLNDAYKYSLGSDAPQVEQPADIKVPLRAHQKAILYAMEQRETQLSRGFDVSGTTLYSMFSFLGDGVGVGKSLMVLGHIARLKQLAKIPRIPKLNTNSSSLFYTLTKGQPITDLSEAGCLVVVPHTLFRQWETYVKEQTSLKCLYVKTKRVLQDTDLLKKAREADVILVSNTLYGTLQNIAYDKIVWKRVFYDEADSIHIPSTRIRPDTHFSWLISASWANLLLPNSTIYAPPVAVNTFINNPTNKVTAEAKKYFESQFQRISQSSSYVRFYMLSSAFFRDFVTTGNSSRGILILRCKQEFVEESIKLPPVYIKNITCRPSLIQQVVSQAISTEARSLLHAGDIQGALEYLGVKPEEPTSLVKAVTDSRLKELDRLKKTYDFKAGLEYATPQAKENALKSLKERISSCEEQIKNLKERIQNYKDEMCPICFDEPQAPTITPCCSRIFCAGCILTSLTRQSTCPLCRSNIGAAGLRHLATAPLAAVNEIVDPNKPPEPLKKTEQLLEIIKNNPNGKFLVFNHFDNPFLQIQSEIEALNVSVRQVRGNKDVIASTLKSFQNGNTRVLLLNTLHTGAGLNITAATHIVLFHAMRHEEEKQILGRAHRLGRTEPLHVIRLLHPDEMLNVQSEA